MYFSMLAVDLDALESKNGKNSSFRVIQVIDVHMLKYNKIYNDLRHVLVILVL